MKNYFKYFNINRNILMIKNKNIQKFTRKFK